jgi:hypothetical protein
MLSKAQQSYRSSTARLMMEWKRRHSLLALLVFPLGMAVGALLSGFLGAWTPMCHMPSRGQGRNRPPRGCHGKRVPLFDHSPCLTPATLSLPLARA